MGVGGIFVLGGGANLCCITVGEGCLLRGQVPLFHPLPTPMTTWEPTVFTRYFKVTCVTRILHTHSSQYVQENEEHKLFFNHQCFGEQELCKELQFTVGRQVW